MRYLKGNGQELTYELNRIQQWTEDPSVPYFYLEKVENAPARPVDGMVAYADGTSWNPGGGGEGCYMYYAGAWNRLG